MQQELAKIISPNKILKLRNWLIENDFRSFLTKSFLTINPGIRFLSNWHLDLISEYLNACEKGDIKRLIINIPPRYLKSTTVTVAWSAWLLGKNPANRLIAASYSQNLSIKHSIDTRTIVSSPWYHEVFSKTKIIYDQNEKHKFMTTKRGFRLATSVGGSITGEGGNFLIVDDPHNPTLVSSNILRENTVNWFDKTFSTRLDDKKNGVFVVVMQRLHENDLSGYLLRKGGWHHLSIPAIADKKTVISFNNFKKIRKEKEVIDKNREDIKEIEQAKKDLGSAGFLAQYQQMPLLEENSLIRLKWFPKYKHIKHDYIRIIQSWDCAIKNNKTSDYSVCITIAEYKNCYFVIDIFRNKLEYPELKKIFLALAEKYNPEAILVEDKASGQQLIQEFSTSTKLPIISIKTKHDKITRINNIISLIEGEKILLPEKAEWLLDFENEITNFPNSAHDDQCDALSQVFNWLKIDQDIAYPSIRMV